MRLHSKKAIVTTISILSLISIKCVAQEKLLWVVPYYNIDYVFSSELFQDIISEENSPPVYFDFYNPFYDSIGVKKYRVMLKYCKRKFQNNPIGYTDFYETCGYLDSSISYSILLDSAFDTSRKNRKKLYEIEKKIYTYSTDKKTINVRHELFDGISIKDTRYFFNANYSIDSIVTIDEISTKTVAFVTDSNTKVIRIGTRYNEKNGSVYNVNYTFSWNELAEVSKSDSIYPDVLKKYFYNGNHVLKIHYNAPYSSIDKFIIKSITEDTLTIFVFYTHEVSDTIFQTEKVVYRQYVFSPQFKGLIKYNNTLSLINNHTGNLNMTSFFLMDRNKKSIITEYSSPSDRSSCKSDNVIFDYQENTFTIPLMGNSWYVNKYIYTYNE